MPWLLPSVMSSLNCAPALAPLVAADGEGEVVLLAQLLEALQAVDEDEDWRGARAAIAAGDARFQVARRCSAMTSAAFRPALPRVTSCGTAASDFARENRPPASRARRVEMKTNFAAAGRVLRGEREQREPEHRERGFIALADDEQMVAALPLEDRFGRPLDRIRRAEPDARRARRGGGRRVERRRRADRSRGSRRARCPRRRSGCAWRSHALLGELRALCRATRRAPRRGSQTTWNGLLPSTAPAASL